MTYILDTSAIRALSREKLQALAKLQSVGVSPVTFYELMCHLDETDEKKDFGRQRGQVLKCGLVPMLPDPFAYHAHEGIFRTMCSSVGPSNSTKRFAT